MGLDCSGVLYTLCQLGEMAGAIVSTEQGCLNVCHAGATLVVWLGLVWARVPGSLRQQGQLACLDPDPVYTIKVEEESDVSHDAHQPL